MTNLTLYLNKFQQIAHQLDAALLKKQQIELAVGVYKESVFLKLYKITWANKSDNLLTSESRIFFSIWINGTVIKEHKLFYNIHALKLRKLNGYSITSRDFASHFRANFKPFENSWPNVSTSFGPLTLMEGFIEINPDSFENEILALTKNFLQIDYLIDDLLIERKK